ncbi:glycosyltransferase [Candidatus Roizmanbacteria bacterium CG_4_10_14_0_2_um_filter_36_35]|uniref:Glycosyltransferase n=4 Tax=Candidatus Roizmaniibacteriota TaxID=1752723 RepID=A0A2M7BX02_9BACT|nr:MAG: glycosyltransferase [Candidatus Roizmanbacteria bacterium CG11_big_fil_rev_8_21_14_0_20_35_14]PIV11059.1 MAG: glycosyltransferase [Candidatus Roizmanbacteria bacterium CG03_land_8_20_14_0_80_35_26]PIZ68616.1 MAG: glycosyltransferase [Candidatus Roizmanbacteria bacterium CG_4_10_14_0_2_um_filter_36_35]PJC32185.1 MAG: glycosyltransferase [Candidatus Roizmanbacteria bacterium CG_4_9_14_0_2_um_filter_36_12]
MNNFLLSVIVPVYNEENNIKPLFDRLFPIVKKYSYEIIFVDDGSTDKTVNTIKKISGKNSQIKLISFYRNFSHQMALSAGYEAACGDAVITIDADLQDPPEIIDKMINKWQRGAKIVYAKRQERQGESFFKLGTASLFYKLINFLSDTPIPSEVGDFRLLDKTVVSYLNSLKERPSFLRGLVAWPGFPTEYVYFKRDKRFSGETHYGFFKMLNFALDGIMSFSTKPLRLATYFGFMSASLGFLGIVYEVIKKILYPESFVTGWIGLFIAVLFIGGIQLMTIGIIGEYVGKIYKEIQNRPKYLIKERINI